MGYENWTRKQKREFDELLDETKGDLKVDIAFCKLCGAVTYIKGKDTKHKCEVKNATNTKREEDSSS